MTTIVDVQLVEGLGLPYAAGAEAGLLDAALDPIFNDAWQAFVATFPGLTLVPLFDGLPVEQLADLVDGIRVNGDEPPDPFVWFTLVVRRFDCRRRRRRGADTADGRLRRAADRGRRRVNRLVRHESRDGI